MTERYRFDRNELAGALGDLGALLPIAMAMVLFNGLNGTGLFLSIGVFYVVSGMYYGITAPVQPMKVIGAYAIATAMSPGQISASMLLIGFFLIITDFGEGIDIPPGKRISRGFGASSRRSVFC
ncbi:MAG: putative sulfate/molybdate transporter [Desulfococcaceae bacterium]